MQKPTLILLLSAFAAACGGGDEDAGPQPGEDGGGGGGGDGAVLDGSDPSDGSVDDDSGAGNMPPLVSIAPVADVVLPAMAALDGTVSDDGLPVGGTLTTGWVMLAGPGLVTFGDTLAVDTTASFSVSGDYMLGLSASDGAVMSSATVMVHVLDAQVPTNIIGTIGDRSVDVGSTLTLDLEKAGAATSTTVVFNVLPMPLESGMSLVRSTGLFKFSPSLAQVGPHPITFLGKDANGTDQETITITVVGPQPGAPTSLSGRVLDANDASIGIITPLAGVTIRSLDVAQAVVSSATGYFTLSGLPPGGNYIEYDGSTVPNQRIAGYRARYNLPGTVNTVIDRPIYLMHIEVAFEVTVNPSLTTVVNNTRIGVKLTIPPFTAKADDGSDYTGNISISEVPAKFTPGAFPPALQPGLVVTVQPMGITFLNPAPVVFPNIDNLAPGSTLQVWSLNHRTGRMFVAGTSSVTPDGSQVSSMTGGLREASWHLLLPPGGSSEDACNTGTQSECIPCRIKQQATAVSPHDGSTHTEHKLPSGDQVGGDPGLGLRFSSQRACPKPLAQINSTIPAASSVPPKQSASLRVGGVELGRAVYTDTSGLPENGDQTIRQSYRVDARDIPSGVYPYNWTLINWFGRQAVGSSRAGNMIINNGIASPFGAGWMLSSLSQIYPGASSVLLVEGADRALRFDAPPLQPSALTNHSVQQPLSVGGNGYSTALHSADCDGDGLGDIIIVAGGPTRALVAYRGNGTGFSEASRVTVPPSYSDTTVVEPLLVADLNGDETPDVAYAYGSTAGTCGSHIEVRMGVGNCSFGAPSVYTVGGCTSDIEAADLNGDGVRDLALSNISGVEVFFNSASGEVLTTPSTLFAGGAKQLELADIDLDGNTDIVCTRNSGPPAIHWLRGNGNGTFSADATLATMLGAPNAFELFDLDNNGYLDVITALLNPTALEVALGYKNGFAPAARSLAVASFGDVRLLNVEDINGDGIGDVLLGDRTAAQVAIALGDGSGSFPTAAFQRFPVTVAAGVSSPNAPVLVNSGRPGVATIATSHYSARDISIDDVTLSPPAPLTYKSPPGDNSKLVHNADQTYTRTFGDRTSTNFDAAGHQIERVDERGGVSSYGWDASGRLSSLSDSHGRATTISYGASGYQIRDYVNRTTDVILDANNDVSSITDPDGTTESFSYNADHMMVSQTSKNGDTTTCQYTSNCEVRSCDFYQSAPTTIVAATAGRGVNLSPGQGTETNPAPVVFPDDIEASITDGSGNVTFLDFDDNDLITSADTGPIHVDLDRDGQGHVVRFTDPNDVSSLATWTSNSPGFASVSSRTEGVGTTSQRTAMVTPGPDSTSFSTATLPGGDVFDCLYDTDDDLESVTNSQGFTTTVVHDAQHRVSQVTDESGATTEVSYDSFDRPANFRQFGPGIPDLDTAVTWTSANQLATITNAAGTPQAQMTTYTHDVMDRTTSITDANGQTTSYVYDANGNVAQTQFSIGRTIARIFDAADQEIEIDDSALGLTSIAYDPAGHEITEVGPTGEMSSFEWSPVGYLTAVTTSRGREVYNRDAAGLLTSFTDVNGQTTLYAYDSLRRLISHTDPLGRVRSYTWSPDDWLLSTRNERAQTINNSYDTSGRLTARSGSGVTVSMGYDRAGRMLFAQDTDSRVQFTYDSVGRLLTQTTVDLGSQTAVTLTNTFDAAGNRTAMSDSFGGNTSFAYNGGGLITSVTTPNGAVIGRSYDSAGRISVESCPNNVGTTYSYGTGLDPDEISVLLNGSTVIEDLSYSHAPNGDVLTLTPASGTVSTFVHDAVGRLTAAGTGALPESYSYDGANRRTSSSRSASYTYNAATQLTADAQYTYTYDLSGNRLTRRQTSNGVTTTFSYDAENQMTGFVRGALSVAYRYDALGRLIEKRVNGATLRRYVWDRTNLVMTFTGTNLLEARYIQTEQLDRPLAFERGANTYCYHADNIGSIYAVTDGAGAVVDRYSYDAFGNMLSVTEAVPNLLTFVGREWDPDAALYNMRTRWYDPNLGGFIQADAFGFGGGDVNIYAYAGSDPVGQIDPYGRGGPEPDPRVTPGDMRTTVLQQVYRGAEEAGFRIAGKSDVKVVQRDGYPPKLVITVRLDQNGEPLQRREDARRNGGPQAASLLTIEVNVSWGLDGYAWNANAHVTEVVKNRITSAGGCGPSEQQWEKARNGRRYSTFMNDPESREYLNGLFPTEANVAVSTALGRLGIDNGRVRYPTVQSTYSRPQPLRARRGP